MNDPHDAIWQAAALLRQARREAAGKPSVVAAINAKIEDLIDLDDEITLSVFENAAVALTALTDILDAAISAIKADISNFLLSQLLGLAQKVDGEAGKAHQALEPARAPAAPFNAPEPSTPAAPLGAAVAAAPATDPATELVALFDSCEIKSNWQKTVDAIIDRIVANTARYRSVEQKASVPWWFIAIVHSLEASGNFGSHLHNGDPLSARTVHIPPGRPKSGTPPFQWEDSAVDALDYDGLSGKADWSLPLVLDRLERYNGLGYRKRRVPSPYLWSGSQHYTKGKYRSDGNYDPDLVSDQAGAAVILRRMVDRRLVGVTKTRQIMNAMPLVALGSLAILSIDDAKLPKSAKAELAFPGKIAHGASGLAVRRVQEWLCHHGFATSVDEAFGSATAKGVTNFRIARQLPSGEEVDEECWMHLTAPLRRAIAPLAVADPSLYAATLAVGRQHLKEGPREIGGANSGPWVRVYMDGLQGEPQKWCAGFVCFLIAQAARNLGASMPFPRQVGVDELVQDAKASGRFIAEGALGSAMARQSKLVPGCLFVRRSPTDATDWVHTGLYVRGEGDTFRTMEGNTNGAVGGYDDDAAVERTRSYPNTDFILLI